MYNRKQDRQIDMVGTLKKKLNNKMKNITRRELNHVSFFLKMTF